MTTSTTRASDALSRALCEIDIRFSSAELIRTPAGSRLMCVVGSGDVTGPDLRGSVLPGSADWISVGEDLVAELDVRAIIRTDDGADIEMTSTGRAQLGSHLERFLGGGTVTAAEAYIRSLPLFRTSDERYAHLNAVTCVARCDISLSGVHYRVRTLG